MIQPETAAEAPSAAPQLAEVGCLGRLTQFAETDDGRYLIALTGLIRFRRIGEPTVRTPYCQCLVDYSDFVADFEPSAGEEFVDRAALMRSFRAFADAKNLAVDWESVEAVRTAELVNALSALAPFGVQEKQALLEARDLTSRAAILVAVAEIELVRGEGLGTIQ